MRPLIASVVALISLAPIARAADLPSRVAAFRPAPVHTVRPTAAVVALVPVPLQLECSPYTGQPITVIYNEPGRTPWSVEPGLALEPLPRAKPFNTRAAFPRGY